MPDEFPAATRARLEQVANDDPDYQSGRRVVWTSDLRALLTAYATLHADEAQCAGHGALLVDRIAELQATLSALEAVQAQDAPVLAACEQWAAAAPEETMAAALVLVDAVRAWRAAREG